MFPIQKNEWVIDKKFDLIFFLCPISLGLLYFLSLMLAPTHALLITAIVWVVFAQTHFGSTWFIFFDKRNREYYSKHPLIYYVGPVLIFFGTLAFGYYNQTMLVILIAIVSLYHVAKQNTGILQLYRMRNNEKEKIIRKVENFTIFAWTLFFGAFGALHIPYFVAAFGPLLPAAVAAQWSFFGGAVAGTVWILVQYAKREHNSFPKTVFLLTSILMYSPYLYASTVLVNIYQMEIATLTSLIAHYMQYIGLVWLINVNKYSGESDYGKQNHFMHVLSGSYWYIGGAIVLYAAAMAALRWGVSPTHPILFSLVPNVVSGLMMIHFYIDSFIWKFRNPFVRETVLPFIKPAA